MSASQLVRSHAVSPADPATEGPPNPEPSIVTLTDPVAAALALSTWLTWPVAADSANDALPTRLPEDTDIRRLPPDICPACPRTEVSDSHVVCSPREPPILTWTEKDLKPSPQPPIVTLVDPVAAQFALAVVLTQATSCEKLRDALPPCTPIVNRAARLLPTPASIWHRSDVSESHDVLSHPLRPSLADAVQATEPSLDPSTVKLLEPVAATLLRQVMLAVATSLEKPAERLDSLPPTLTATRRVAVPAAPSRHRSEVSDPHLDPSHAVTPFFAKAL